MYDRVVHRRAFVTTATVAVVILLVAGACGSSEYRFVSNSNANAYFKVPHSWAEIGQDQLIEAQAKLGGTDFLNALDESSMLAEKLEEKGLYKPPVLWRVAFDSHVHPSIEHVVLAGNEAPVVDVLVRDLTGETPEEMKRRNQASASFLENLFYVHLRILGAFDDAMLQQLVAREVQPDFIIWRDLRFDDGVRRIRQTASYRGPNQEVYTIDQTGVIDADTEKMYIFVIRAREQEFLANYDVIEEIASSFTVKRD